MIASLTDSRAFFAAPPLTAAMSDTEEFDKEAEKEKLREQLRREEENRRATQHMSELLLKGATMTNKHCDTCGDPLFRYEGQEFCPTCSQAEAEAAGSQEAVDAGGVDRIDGPRQAADEGGEATGTTQAEPGMGIQVADSRAAGAPVPSQPTPSAADVPEDVSAARAALVRKLATLTRQAEATDDVSRSRELLAAAREAAEALAAVDSLRG